MRFLKHMLVFVVLNTSTISLRAESISLSAFYGISMKTSDIQKVDRKLSDLLDNQQDQKNVNHNNHTVNEYGEFKVIQSNVLRVTSPTYKFQRRMKRNANANCTPSLGHGSETAEMGNKGTTINDVENEDIETIETEQEGTRIPETEKGEDSVTEIENNLISEAENEDTQNLLLEAENENQTSTEVSDILKERDARKHEKKKKKKKKKKKDGMHALMKKLPEFLKKIHGPSMYLLGMAQANFNNFVMHVLMLSKMALLSVIMMIIREAVFGDKDKPVKYYNFGYDHPPRKHILQSYDYHDYKHRRKRDSWIIL